MHNETYDMAIVGCGPAGLSAAVNAHIRRKNLALFGVKFCAPKLFRSPWIDNYLGFPHIKGEELRERFLNHVQEMGISITRDRVDAVYQENGSFSLQVSGRIYRARTVIIATGVEQVKLLPGEEPLVGKGVSYCATCDGPLYKGKTVAMVSYTQDGEEEVKFLAEMCTLVYYIPQYDEAPDTIPGVTVIKQKPKRILGEDTVSGLELEDRQLTVEGVFIERESVPAGQLVPGINMNGNYIQVDREQATNIPGLYAAGDCTGKPFQLAKAVGEGQVAALNAVKYLDA
nr:NAD(P)/FAD-dependent oxidoreductase [Calderihabitans maritimus]